MELDATGIRFQIEGCEKTVNFSELENLRFQYKTYGGWWSHNFYGNENIFSFITNEGEKYSFEIILQDKKHKERFKELISIHDPVITTRGLNIGRAAF